MVIKMVDPYEVLGVNRNVSDQELKKEYRRLSKQFHPDNNQDNPNKKYAEERFKDIQAAYEQIMRERSGDYSGNYYNTHENSTTARDDRRYSSEKNSNSDYYREWNNSFNGDENRNGNTYYGRKNANRNDFKDSGRPYGNNTANSNNSYSEDNYTNSYGYGSYGNRNSGGSTYSGAGGNGSNYNNSYYGNANGRNTNYGNTAGSNSNYGNNSYYGNAGAGYNGYYSGNGYGFRGTNTGGTYREPEKTTSQFMGKIAEYINSGRFYQAIELLQTIEKKDDMWYYYSAVANIGMGNNAKALSQAKIACAMKPEEPAYTELVQNIEGNSVRYQEVQNNFNPFSVKRSSAKTGLLIAAGIMCASCGGSGFGIGRFALCCL